MAYTPNIYKKGSVLYLKNGMLPLIPGTSISPTGIPSYFLTKEEGSYQYYDKTTSDARFVNSAGDLIEGEVYLVPKTGNSVRIFGARFVSNADYGLKTGLGVKNNDATPQLIAWFTREGTGTDSKIEIGITREDASTPTILTLKSDGTFNVSRTAGISNNGDVLTWATGIKKNGDVIEGGTYDYRAGKLRFFSLTDVEGVFREVMAFDFLADGVTNVLDLKGNYIKGSGLTPTDNNHLIPKKYADDLVEGLEDLIDNINVTLTASITALGVDITNLYNSILKLKIRNWAGY